MGEIAQSLGQKPKLAPARPGSGRQAGQINGEGAAGNGTAFAAEARSMAGTRIGAKPAHS
jgi:hypothetical protein